MVDTGGADVSEAFRVKGRLGDVELYRWYTVQTGMFEHLLDFFGIYIMCNTTSNFLDIDFSQRIFSSFENFISGIKCSRVAAWPVGAGLRSCSYYGCLVNSFDLFKEKPIVQILLVTFYWLGYDTLISCGILASLFKHPLQIYRSCRRSF